jgi:rfaE bifunctional protein nucleotidyltransferase chain/domain
MLGKVFMKNEQTVVLVTGVFDLLHEEHIKFLEKAKALGDALVVGVESDERVAKIKGRSRPVQPSLKRVEQIKDLSLASQVVVLPEEFDQPEHHLEFLQKIKPDVLAVSSHTPHLDEKRQLMAKIGGRVEVVHTHNPKVSTTQIIGE